jgi:hypothetical protein
MNRVTTKIYKDVLDEVREFADANGYSIVWFISDAARQKLNAMKIEMLTRKKYPFISNPQVKESNKKKK